jgi:hypothetical protein
MTGAAIPKIRLPAPHPGQRAVREQAKRFNWLAAGRRWRKTTLVMAITVENAVAGKEIIWGAPTFDQVRIGWKEAERACGNYATFLKQEKIAHFPGGGSIIFRSLDDPDNARGHTADGVVVDESADVSPDAWYDVLRPMLIDTNGWAWLIGTFKGFNWFSVEHGNALASEDSMAWQAPTLGCKITGPRRIVREPHPLENPNIPFSEVENIFLTQPETTFRQEILSELVQGEGAVFRNITANLYKGNEKPEQHKGHIVVAGVDWGAVNDFTAISIACETCARELELDRFNKIDWDFQRARLVALLDKWDASYTLAEENSIGSPNLEALQKLLPQRKIAGFMTTAQSKPPLIQSLALCLEQSEMKWLDVPIATRELEAYEAKRNEVTNRIQYSAPQGFHDDTVIARALVREAIEERKRNTWGFQKGIF